MAVPSSAIPSAATAALEQAKLAMNSVWEKFKDVLRELGVRKEMWPHEVIALESAKDAVFEAHEAYIRAKVRGEAPTLEDASLYFALAFNAQAQEAYETAKSKGWYEKPVEDGTRIALMHSELSEALEALRHGNPPDDKVPEFSGVEAELADVVIRILDYAGAKGLNIGGAIVAKMAMNKGRDHRHGGKAF